MPFKERTANNANAIHSPQAILYVRGKLQSAARRIARAAIYQPKKKTGSTHKALPRSTLRRDDDLDHLRAPDEGACTLTQATLKGESL
jgi:hypothetical protein